MVDIPRIIFFAQRGYGAKGPFLDSHELTVPDCWPQFRLSCSGIGFAVSGLYAMMGFKGSTCVSHPVHGAAILRVRRIITCAQYHEL